ALQLCRVSFSYPPEIGEGTVVPQKTPICHLVQLGYTHSVFVCMNMLSYNVHGHLGQIQVRAHSRCGGDACCFQNVQDDGPGQFPCCHLVGIQVVGNVHEHLVNAVGIDVLRGNVFQIHLIDPRAPIDIVGHPGRSYDVVQLQRQVLPHLRVIPGRAAELISGR
ncbi:YbaK/aminoacyl-tRNA synthetase-associated domain-containing protein, partial [Dysosmobacter welbionis]